MEMIKKLHRYLNGLSTFKFILIMTFLTFLIVLPMIPFIVHLEQTGASLGGIDLQKELSTQPIILILLVAFIAPLVETFISQWVVIKLLRFIPFISHRSGILAVVSAITFGLGHTYSLLYMIAMFFVGLLLAYSYLLYETKNKHPFWVVTAIHSLRNSISIMVAPISLIGK